MNTSLRLLIILIAGGYIAWQLWKRVQQANNTSNADAAEMNAWKAALPAIQADARYQRLLAYAKTEGLTNDPAHVAVLDVRGQSQPLSALEQGAFLVIYAKEAQGHKQYALSLADDLCTTTDLSSMAYQAVVPSWASQV